MNDSKKPETAEMESFLAFCRARAELPPISPSHSRDCPHCAGRGFLRIEKDGYPFIQRCICQRRFLVEQAFSHANLPPKYWNTTLELKPKDGREPFIPYGGTQKDPQAIASQTEALQTCRRLRDSYFDVFLHGKPASRVDGLLLFGQSGRGKTRLVCSLLADLIEGGLTDVKFIEYNELFKLIGFSYRSETMRSQSIFEPLIATKILVIDDLGTDLAGNLVWVLDNIGYIINERYNMNRPTLFTCNHWEPLGQEQSKGSQASVSADSLYQKPSWQMRQTIRDEQATTEGVREIKEIGDRVSYRLRSRIREMCIELELQGPDYRNWLAKQRSAALEKDKRRQSLLKKG